MSSIDLARRHLGPHWALGAAIAFLLHGGAAIGAIGLIGASDESDVGAAATEIAIDYEAPHREQDFLPPGPEADYSAAAPETVAQEKKAEASDLPQEKAQDDPDAERQAAPEPSKAKDQKKPDAAQVETAASAAASASEAAAAPSAPEARAAPLARAPALGIGASQKLSELTWQKQLAAHLNKAKHFPAEAEARGGSVTIRFRIDRMGHVLAASVVQAADHPAFAAEALAMLKRADPLPVPPPGLGDDQLSFTLPIVFRPHGKG